MLNVQPFEVMHFCFGFRFSYQTQNICVYMIEMRRAGGWTNGCMTERAQLHCGGHGYYVQLFNCVENFWILKQFRSFWATKRLKLLSR